MKRLVLYVDGKLFREYHNKSFTQHEFNDSVIAAKKEAIHYICWGLYDFLGPKDENLSIELEQTTYGNDFVPVYISSDLEIYDDKEYVDSDTLDIEQWYVDNFNIDLKDYALSKIIEN